MQIDDIEFVGVDWMLRWENDPMLYFILKAGKTLTSDHRYQAYPSRDLRHPNDVLYFSEHENEVSFYYQVHNNQAGYAGSTFSLKMVDGTVAHLKGPWSSNSAYARLLTGVASFYVATVEGSARHDLPEALLIHQAEIHAQWGKDAASMGIPMSAHYTIDFIKQVLAAFVPDVDLVEHKNPSGWLVKHRTKTKADMRHPGIQRFARVK